MPSKCLVSANENAYPLLFSMLVNKHQLGVLPLKRTLMTKAFFFLFLAWIKNKRFREE